MYKLAIFDFDGTLGDSVGWVKGVFNQVAERYRFRRCTPEELEALRHQDSRAIIEYLGISWWKLPLVAFHVRRLVARDARRIPLFPGVTAMLDELHARGMRIAIVSTNSEDNVRRILGADAASRVHHYACGAGVFGKRSKLREVLKRSGTSPREAIAIGDEGRDIDAASAEGIATAAVTWGFASAELLRSKGPTAIFSSVDELSRALTPA